MLPKKQSTLSRGMLNLFWATLFVLQLSAQQRSIPLTRPYGISHSLVSPNGAYALFGNEQNAQLWLENRITHEQMLVLRATVQTLTLSWSPDSTSFIANDREASDFEQAYIYNVLTLARLDLRHLILAADPHATRFVSSEHHGVHSYVHATRWWAAAAVEVQLHGHTDGYSAGNRFHPVQCFDLRYRVTKQGALRKISERVVNVSPTGCGAMESTF